MIACTAPLLPPSAPPAILTNDSRTVKVLKTAIEESKKRFETCVGALLKDFDAHAAAAAPPPSLLPSTVTIIVASRGVRFDTQLLPTHFPENVYGKVGRYLNTLELYCFFSGCDLLYFAFVVTTGLGNRANVRKQ